MTKRIQKIVEDYIARELEYRSFEDILEDFDLEATEVFVILFNLGYIDEELLELDFDQD